MRYHQSFRQCCCAPAHEERGSFHLSRGGEESVSLFSACRMLWPHGPEYPLLKNVLVLYSVAACKTGKGTPRICEDHRWEGGSPKGWIQGKITLPCPRGHVRGAGCFSRCASAWDGSRWDSSPICSLYHSPQLHICRRTGSMLRPSSVREYSTFGGTCA
jgi:hypothetical protein